MEPLGLLVPGSVELIVVIEGSFLVAALAADVVYLLEWRSNPVLEDLPALFSLDVPSCSFYSKKRY